MQVHFYLREPTKNKPTMIQLKCRYQPGSLPLVFSTKFKIHPKHWDFKRERPHITYVHYSGLSTLLANLESVCHNAFLQSLNSGTLLRKATLKSKLNHFLTRKQDQNLISFTTELIKQKTGILSASTISNYRNLLSKLIAFDHRLTFDDINLDFLDKFVSMLNDENLAQSTIKTTVSNLKSVIRTATDRGINKNTAYQSPSFTVKSAKITMVFLTEDELNQFHNTPCQKIQEKVRDLFIIMAWTGLRFSDVNQISRSTITAVNGLDTLYIPSQIKTGAYIRTPLHDNAKEILQKYDFQLPELNHSYFNKHIKTIAKLAGITQPVQHIEHRAGTITRTTVPKYKLISAHTARRSLICNMYIAGYNLETIAKLIGQTSVSTTIKYLHLSGEDHIQLASPFFNRIAI